MDTNGRNEGTPAENLLSAVAERPTCTVDEAAHLLGVSRAVAYRAARAGELPGALRLRGRIVVAVRPLLNALGMEKD